MIENFRPDRQAIAPLTAQIASQRFSMAWIEASDPVNAVRRMAASLKSGRANCALWVNAGDYIDGETKSLVRAWNAARQHYPEVEIVAHMKKMEELLQQSAAPESIRAELRSDDKSRTMGGQHDCHVDSNDGSYRFLQSIECMSTFLLEPKNAVFRALTLDDCKKLAAYYGSDIEKEKRHIGTKEWTLREDDTDVVFWETPRNSLLLISDDQFAAGQPILHSLPFKPADQQQEFRTVTLYDCYNPSLG